MDKIGIKNIISTMDAKSITKAIESLNNAEKIKFYFATGISWEEAYDIQKRIQKGKESFKAEAKTISQYVEKEDSFGIRKNK